jgi:hypothetical protein
LGLLQKGPFWRRERASSTFEQAWVEPQDIKTDKEKHELRHKLLARVTATNETFVEGKMCGRTFGMQSLR